MHDPLTDDIPVLDSARLSSSSLGSAELRDVLLQTFRAHARPRLRRLGELCGAQDAHGVEFEAHGLKGMCATLGAARCAAVFAEVERIGREGGLEGVSRWLDIAEIELARVEALVPRGEAA